MADLGTVRGQVRLDVRQAVASYAALRAQNQRTVYALRGTGDSFVAAGQRMVVAGGGIVYAFGKMVGAAAEFERKMDFFGAVQKTSKADMKELVDETLNLAKTSIFSADAIAEGVVELGKAGVDAQGIIGGIGQAMVNLGAAGDIPLADAGRYITSTIQQFDMGADKAVNVVDLLAGAANASIVDIEDLGVSLKYAGGVASAVGLDFEDTLTAISLLGKAGIRGSTAGTSLRQMLVSLGGATGPARASLEELGIITENGSNKFFDAEGKAKSLSQVFQILQDHTADLTNKQRLMHLRTIFNNRALSAASILTREGADGFKEMNREMTKVSAAKVASDRLENLSGDLEILQSNLHSVMIEAGSPFQEELRKWVQGITKLVQAFGKLDKKTQESIIRWTAYTGVALLALGTFNIVVGTIFRFIAAIIKMGAGLKFAWKVIRVTVFNLRWLAALILGPVITALGAITAPVWIAIAVIAALAAAFIIAYKKIEPFRELVDKVAGAIWDGLKKIGGFFKLLVTDPAKAWDQIKAKTSQFITAMGGFFSRLPGLLKGYLMSALQSVGSFIAGVGRWFASLPGKILGLLMGFVSRVMELFTFRNIGYAIGFLIGTMVRLWITLQKKIWSIASSLVDKVIGFFAKLPRRIGYFIGFMVGRSLALLFKFGKKMLSWGAKTIAKLIVFFSKLPGRIAEFLKNMAIRGATEMVKFAIRLPDLARQLVTGVINFFRTLPARSAEFFVKLVTKGIELFKRLKTRAIEFAKGLFRGFVDAIKGLPEALDGIVDDMIAAFKDKITDAANAVKDFAEGMWEGFKDGIGMHSPSHFERAMWQITGVMDKETKKLAKKTMDVQKMSKKLAETSFTVGDPGAPPVARKYADLASMHDRNQKRSRTLLTTSSERGDRADRVREAAGNKELKIEINNPKPERASRSVKKTLQDKVEEAGWR